MKMLVLFYSTYGHNHIMAKAALEGAKRAGVDADLRKVKETLSDEILQKMGALEAKESQKDVKILEPQDLKDYDAMIFLAPTRFGNMPAQMKAFFDATGSLWQNGDLIGKIAGVMTSSATQHGGQESTILSIHTVLLHQGFIIAGLPYSFKGQMTLDEISGGSPYGASTITGGDGSRMPSENELDAARFQAEHIANIAKRMF